jgi:hypothetical protein
MKKFNLNNEITFYPSHIGYEQMRLALKNKNFSEAEITDTLDMAWDNGNDGYTMSLWQFIHLFHPLVYHGTKAFDTMKIKLHKH